MNRYLLYPLIIVFALTLFLFQAEATAGNKSRCLDWCQYRDRCEFCSTNPGCGVGYTRMKRFGGSGRNWHACRSRNTAFGRGSRRSRERCLEWCRNHQEPGKGKLEPGQVCNFCSPMPFCGINAHRLKTFRVRPGRNWNACWDGIYTEGPVQLYGP